MMSKAVQLGAAPLPATRALPAADTPDESDHDGASTGRQGLPPPPAYEALPRGSRTYGYTSLLD